MKIKQVSREKKEKKKTPYRPNTMDKVFRKTSGWPRKNLFDNELDARERDPRLICSINLII